MSLHMQLQRVSLGIVLCKERLANLWNPAASTLILMQVDRLA